MLNALQKTFLKIPQRITVVRESNVVHLSLNLLLQVMNVPVNESWRIHQLPQMAPEPKVAGGQVRQSCRPFNRSSPPRSNDWANEFPEFDALKGSSEEVPRLAGTEGFFQCHERNKERLGSTADQNISFHSWFQS